MMARLGFHTPPGMRRVVLVGGPDDGLSIFLDDERICWRVRHVRVPAVGRPDTFVDYIYQATDPLRRDRFNLVGVELVGASPGEPLKAKKWRGEHGWVTIKEAK